MHFVYSICEKESKEKRNRWMFMFIIKLSGAAKPFETYCIVVINGRVLSVCVLEERCHVGLS